MSIAVKEGRFSESRDFCFGDRIECSKFTDSNLEGICLKIEYSKTLHCVKSVQIRTRETPYLDTFCAVLSNNDLFVTFCSSMKDIVMEIVLNTSFNTCK